MQKVVRFVPLPIQPLPSPSSFAFYITEQVHHRVGKGRASGLCLCNIAWRLHISLGQARKMSMNAWNITLTLPGMENGAVMWKSDTVSKVEIILPIPIDRIAYIRRMFLLLKRIRKKESGRENSHRYVTIRLLGSVATFRYVLYLVPSQMSIQKNKKRSKKKRDPSNGVKMVPQSKYAPKWRDQVRSSRNERQRSTPSKSSISKKHGLSIPKFKKRSKKYRNKKRKW